MKRIESTLKYISEQLWSGNASIMIGAGFSMNADCVSIDDKKFPTWNQLAEKFYIKIHGIPPDRKTNLNPMKLAEEIEAMFGRTILDNLLKSEIPNSYYNPSVLHERLLNLPWQDVFTTNYDTLLERQALDIYNYKYQVILNNEDLLISSKPRIVKLHGTFDSIRPFIITEEDYRTYPRVFAPFINTVQQSLLENILCLIGFSGDDPNFNSWIGWLRDNFEEKHLPKIYLIDFFNDISEGKKKVLESKNIVLVDLSEYDKYYNYKIALQSVFDYFEKTKINTVFTEWDGKLNLKH